jgi:pimeloyl-ACP methyl ester carboxylesterase
MSTESPDHSSRIRECRLELGGFPTRALELEGSGPSLILLHGWADSADTWRPLLALLARKGRHALAVDMPGFGRAGRLDPERPILAQLDRFAAAAVRREAERNEAEVVIAGNSLGGCAALRVAERPELPLAGVAPIAPAGLDMAQWLAIIEGAPLIQVLMRSPMPVPERLVREAVGRVYRTLAFARPAALDREIVDRFTGHMISRRDVARVLATGRRLLPELREGCFRLERISYPVLLVWGKGDRMVFAAGARDVLEAVPGARLVLIDDCGHCPQIEAAERLAELLDEFPAPLPAAA